MRTVQDLVFDDQPLDDVVQAGGARVDGDTAALARFLASFDDRHAR